MFAHRSTLCRGPRGMVRIVLLGACFAWPAPPAAAQSLTIGGSQGPIATDPPLCQAREARRELADAWVSTRDQLEAAIASGATLIWIENTASIDLSPTGADINSHVLRIPSQVTLASGRSPTQQGGLLYYAGQPERPLYMLRLGWCTRVTGLRLRGPSRSTERGRPRTTALWVRGNNQVLIDNNEFSDWPGAGVWIEEAPNSYQTARTIRVTGNFFHHNLMCGGGYGVVFDSNSEGSAYGGFALIDRNVFNYNRHSVAGDGHPHSGYLAEYNLVLSGGRQCDSGWYDPGYYEQHFDMHGFGPGSNDGYGGSAGEIINIRFNTIRGEQNYYLTETRPAFMLRGIPTVGAYFFRNVLAHDNRDEAIKETVFYDCTAGCLLTAAHVSDSGNIYDVDTSLELAVGDFDGDGHADVFQATGTQWMFSARGQSDWRVLKVATERLAQLAFGDFDGNGRTDVFTQQSGRWLVAYDGTSAWTPLPASSSIDMRTYRFGDFDGDGRTDVFRANGTQWFYSSGGTTAWLPLAISAFREDKLRFGDFDGDGTTDVFSLSGGVWSVSYGGRLGWRRLNGLLSSSLSELVLADFNGDGVTDVARQYGTTYQVSWSGIGSWTTINSNTNAGPMNLTSMLVADFTGDGSADLLQHARSVAATGISIGEKFVMSSAARLPFSTRSRHAMR